MVMKFKDLKLPGELRFKFAKPLDKLIAGSREETIPKTVNYFKEIEKRGFKLNFYLVGDIVTKDFINNPFLKKFIKVSIIDEKTQRKSIEIEFGDIFKDIIEMESPAGIIPKSSWDILRKAVHSNEKLLIKITKGEEDLLVLPLILEISVENGVKNYVIYGQPPITDADINIPQGIVIVDVNEQMKEKVKYYLNLMEEF